MSITVETENETVHALQCLEVWGGNQEIHSGISVPGIDAWISSSPYRGQAHGGDIHFVSLCGAGRISRFVIADVAGHGDAAAGLAERLRHLMRKHINTVDQTRFARALNGELLQVGQTSEFATSLLATYFAPTDHLIVCNLGHPRPLWYHAAAQTWEFLDHDVPQRATAVVNLPLGIIDPTQYEQFAVKLDKGDLVLIYTDALIESTNTAGRQLGEQGLLDLVRGLPADDAPALREQVLAAVGEHHGRAEPADDVTLLVLHHNAVDPPPPTVVQRVHAMAHMIGLGRH
ncbi:MAG: PP2C family protein-serine/threonine phosphatase [Planctomycetota bacterium]|jgi:serine phosphatase RsbU (regulator of sigma subunit)